MLVNIPCNAIRDYALKCQLNQARKTYEVSTSLNLCAAHVPEQMPTPLILLAWPIFCFRKIINTHSTKQHIKKGNITSKKNEYIFILLPIINSYVVVKEVHMQ